MNTVLKQALGCVCLLSALLPAAQSYAAAAPAAPINVQSATVSARDRAPEGGGVLSRLEDATDVQGASATMGRAGRVMNPSALATPGAGNNRLLPVIEVPLPLVLGLMGLGLAGLGAVGRRHG